MQTIPLSRTTSEPAHRDHQPTVRCAESPCRPAVHRPCPSRLAPVTYGIFNAGSTPFVESYTEGRGKITDRVGGSSPIKRTSRSRRGRAGDRGRNPAAETDTTTQSRSVKGTFTGLAQANDHRHLHPGYPAILPLLIAGNGFLLAAGLLVTTYNLTSSFTQPVIGWLATGKKGLTISVSNA